MQQNDDLNPDRFKIFSVTELSAIAYNLYLRNPQLLEKYLQELVKQIICKTLELSNINISDSFFEITLALSADIEENDDKIITENNLTKTKNLLSSEDQKMLNAREALALKIIQKRTKNPKLTLVQIIEEIFESKQGFLSTVKQKYSSYVSSHKIVEMYKNAINIELWQRYQNEQEVAKKRSDIMLSADNKPEPTFKEFLINSEEQNVNNQRIE